MLIMSNQGHEHLMLVVLLALTCGAQYIHGQNSTATPSEAPSTGDNEDKQTPIDKAVEPVYIMANIFLDSIIKPVSLAKLNSTLDMSDFSAVVKSFETDWQTWIKYYYAYIICLVFAVIYILALPITGCVICGCRSCGKCGAKQGPMDGKRTKCCRQMCTGLLLLICIGLLFGVVCMFLANQMLYEETEDRGLPTTLRQSTDRLDTFIEVSRSSYDSYLRSELTDKVDVLRNRLKNAAEEIQKEAGTNTGIGPLMDTLSENIGELNDTNNRLFAIDSSVNDIKAKTSTLSDKLTELKTNITNSFGSCTTLDCEIVTNVSSTLETVADFSSVGSLAAVTQAFTDLLADPDSIYTDLDNSQASYNQIQDAITNSSGDLINTMASEGDKVIGEIDTFLNESLAKIQDISLNNVKMSLNNTVAPKIQTFGRYRYYAGIAMSSAVLLITFICGAGLLFGACGSRKGASTNSCNKGTAISLLKASLGFMFAFAWIIMVIIAVLFPIGGIAHNDICRNLMLPPADPESADVMDGLLVKSLNLPVSFMSLYASCDNEEALYTAMELETLGPNYNISKLLNPDNYKVKEYLDQLANRAYNPGTLDIANSGIQLRIAGLSAATENIDLIPHTTQLNLEITSHNLQDFAAQLKAIAENSTSQAELFMFYATTVEAIHKTEYANVKMEMDILKDLVSKINIFKTQFNATETILLLEDVQDDVTPAIMASAVTSVTSEFGDNFKSLLTDAESSIRSNLARCGPIANIISGVIDGMCVNILQPFNAFWFSAGWCLIFFIFIIPIVIILINFYNKQYEYDPDTLERHSVTSTDKLFSNGRRPGSGRNKYQSRPLPDPTTTEYRGGRIPYEQLPAVSGARASPITHSRDQRNGLETRPEGHSRNGWSRNQHNESPRSYDREWTNLAYDDSHDPAGYQWTADSRDPYHSNTRDEYRDRSRDDYTGGSRDNYTGGSRDPYADYQYDNHRSNRRSMYPDDMNRW